MTGKYKSRYNDKDDDLIRTFWTSTPIRVIAAMLDPPRTPISLIVHANSIGLRRDDNPEGKRSFAVSVEWTPELDTALRRAYTESRNYRSVADRLGIARSEVKRRLIHLSLIETDQRRTSKLQTRLARPSWFEEDIESVAVARRMF